jgi:hypothetical protein
VGFGAQVARLIPTLVTPSPFPADLGSACPDNIFTARLHQLVAVNLAGRRFVSEAVSYHEFTRAMYRSHSKVPTIPAMLVCDSRFLWKYGLGMIRPCTPFLKKYIESGYLSAANSAEELARKIGVDVAGLIETIKANDQFAETGVDTEFAKGNNSYERANGDSGHLPNPCLGPIEKPPYYAVAVVPTPLGTSLGLRTNAESQVLDASDHPIPGLYVRQRPAFDRCRRISRSGSATRTGHDLRVSCGHAHLPNRASGQYRGCPLSRCTMS